MRKTLKIQLRCYQDKSLELLRQEFSKGIDRPLLHLSTGAGKGLLMSHIAERSIRNNYKYLQNARSKETITSRKNRQRQNIDGNKCSDIDHAIDSEVYKLYGLTEEEIKIVEGKE